MTEQPDKSFLEDEIGTPEPPITEFTGDVVDVWKVKANLEKYPDSKDKIKLIIRDWAQSEGRETAYTRSTKWMSITTSKKAELTKLRRQIEKQVGLDVQKFSQFMGLEGDWKLFDVEKGEFSREDVPEYVAKASLARPDPLPPYVPPKRKDEPESEFSDEPATTGSTTEITEEARKAFRDLVSAQGGGPFSEAQIRTMVSKDMGFREKYGPAFGAVIAGHLIREELTETAGKFSA